MDTTNTDNSISDPSVEIPVSTGSAETSQLATNTPVVGNDYSGVGPKNYQRREISILDEINSRLTISSEVDATHIHVEATDGIVTLSGRVASRYEKHRAEDIALKVSGVKDVRNQIRVTPWRELFAETH